MQLTGATRLSWTHHGGGGSVQPPMTHFRRLLASLTLIGAATAAPVAGATDAFTENHSTLSVSALHGIPLGKNVSANPWSNGIGLRYGITFRGGLYLGLSGQSFLFDKGVERYGADEDVIIRGRLGLAAVEVGADWGLLKPLALRWNAGIGAGWGAFSNCGMETPKTGDPEWVCRDGKNPRAMLTSNLVLLGRVSRRIFVTAEVEWLLDTGFSDVTTAGVLAVGAGWRF